MVQRRRHMRLINSQADGIDVGNKSILIAFASTDRTHVDQHFGLAEGFAIYRVSKHESHLIEVAQFDQQKPYQEGHSEDKLTDKIALIDNCVAVYCNAVGPRAVKRLMSSSIQPIKVEVGVLITSLIDELQEKLQQVNIPLWLSKALQDRPVEAENSGDKFSKMFDQNWDESGVGY